jgi:hypothetical protein
MPDHMLDRSEVSKDITSIVNNWMGNVHKKDEKQKGVRPQQMQGL